MAFLPYYATIMKRREALKIIRGAAKAKGLSVTVDTKAGKGSHAKVTTGMRRTTMPKNVSDPLLKAILKQLDLED